MKLREFWGRLFRAKYTSALERDVARLRAENRALLNSILGITGVPPIVVPAEDPAAAIVVDSNVNKAASGGSSRTEAERCAGKLAMVKNTSEVNASEVQRPASNGRGMKVVAAPTRRRSWHQVYRMLEIDAARKKESV
jgi:hypothetical protein